MHFFTVVLMLKHNFAAAAGILKFRQIEGVAGFILIKERLNPVFL
jgi:hypothetical protein